MLKVVAQSPQEIRSSHVFSSQNQVFSTYYESVSPVWAAFPYLLGTVLVHVVYRSDFGHCLGTGFSVMVFSYFKS